MSTRCHRGAASDTHQQTRTHTGRKVMRGSAHILTFCHLFSLSVSCTHIPSPLLSHFFEHMHTNIPEPSKLESEVPIAFLIRNASGGVSKSKLCELQSPPTEVGIKLCLSFCIVTFLHFVKSPVV